MASCCDVCGKSAESLKLCSKCRGRSFCSVECQRLDWPSHKKTRRPDYVRELMGAIDRAAEDGALTAHETKTMKFHFNRFEGLLNFYDLDDVDGSTDPEIHAGMSDADIRRCRVATTAMDVMSILFDVDRGVMVKMKNGQPPRFGFVVMDGPFDASTYLKLWKKKKMITFAVRCSSLANGQDFRREGEHEGEIMAGIEPHRLRMVPIKDTRHERKSPVTQPIPEDVHADEFVGDEFASMNDGMSRDGIFWQYLEDGDWVNYPRGLACRIETAYRDNASYVLYSPGNPHNRDQLTHNTMIAMGEGISLDMSLRMHDTCTRQVIFESSRRGTWVSGRHDQTDNMTEYDMCTKMAWRVRRVGGTPRVGGNGEGRKRSYLFEKGMVDWLDPREKCGLCGKAGIPLMTLPCCNRKVCDTEHDYQLGSYVREGQCMRNHVQNSICGHHHSEGHGGSWKECKECEEEEGLSPYDYVVKASSMHAAWTRRRYNFDDNSRTDIHPADAPFPQCPRCDVKMDTTEENIKTFCMRRNMGMDTICANCGFS